MLNSFISNLKLPLFAPLKLGIKGLLVVATGFILSWLEFRTLGSLVGGLGVLVIGYAIIWNGRNVLTRMLNYKSDRKDS